MCHLWIVKVCCFRSAHNTAHELYKQFSEGMKTWWSDHIIEQKVTYSASAADYAHPWLPL